MGREFRGTIRWQGAVAEGTALLEADALILRGPLRARIARAAVSGGSHAEGSLRLTTTEGVLELDMSEKDALAWLRALAKPPPGLADKLGIGPGKRAFVLGAVMDETLDTALADACTTMPEEAAVLLAILTGPEDLSPAAEMARRTGLPLWCLYPKGKDASPSDAQVRTTLREAGFIDTKACAVSDRLTATRYRLASGQNGQSGP